MPSIPVVLSIIMGGSNDTCRNLSLVAADVILLVVICLLPLLYFIHMRLFTCILTCKHSILKSIYKLFIGYQFSVHHIANFIFVFLRIMFMKVYNALQSFYILFLEREI